VALEQEAIGVEWLVVTALGMTRERRDVGYSIQALTGEAISQTPELNLVNALSGRAAGLQVTNAGPVGGSARIVIRGNSSISGDNQPLFVVDGVPIDNSADTNSGFGGGSGGRSGKDGVSGTNVNQSNAKIAPIEIIESEFSTRLRCFELIPDSGGPGKFRGGLGFVREYELLDDDARFSLRSTKHTVAPKGIDGGWDGKTGLCTLNHSLEPVLLSEFVMALEPIHPRDFPAIPSHGPVEQQRASCARIVSSEGQRHRTTHAAAKNVSGIDL
jgi:hypothetical protein